MHFYKSIFISIFVFLLTSNSNAEIDIQFPVEKFKLKNGLTVLLHRDNSIPMVSYHTWYRVGSRDEKAGVTGAAHMLEHMMFKGAKKYTDKEFDRILHANGIENNAFTSWDYTGFYMNLPSSKLELIMDVEVDRMRYLQLKPEALKSELQVVGEERRWRVDNNPPSLLQEAFLDGMFTTHPYRWPVIGYMEDIQSYTSEKLRHFYDTYYLPNNAVLVIAGDIEIGKTKALVEKYYGDLEAKPLPEKNFPQEPEPRKQVRKSIESEVQNSSVLVGFMTTEAGHKDSYALDLAANILGAGTSSRLYKNLIYEKQKAVGVDVHNITNADPGVFMLMSSMKPGAATSFAEEVFDQEIKKLQSEFVSEKELEKAKHQVMKGYVDGLTTISGKANALAVNEILFGDFRQLFTDLEKYQTVTSADIKKVVTQYLKPNRKVTAILNPKKKK